MNRKGFSLVEMAIGMLIIAAALGSVVAILPTSSTKDNITEVNSKLDKIEAALLAFYHENGYLPCPATRTDLPNTANFGVSTNCAASGVTGVTDITPTSMSIRIGSIPVRTLNLTDDFMYDSWNMRINYALVKSLGVDANTYITASSSPSDPFTINDKTNTKINILPTSTFTTYTLWSSGPNRKGATNSSGTIPVTCGTAGLDFENCDLDATFADSPRSDAASTLYDDFFRWRTNSFVNYASGGPPVNCNTPVGGFTPSTMFGCFLWLDASDQTTFTLNGSSKVTQWRDKTVSVFRFTPNGSNYATYSSTGFNGKPTVIYNNSNGLKLSGASQGYSTNRTSLTIFFVGQQNTTSGANTLMDMAYNSSKYLRLNLNMNGGNFWYNQNGTTLPAGITNSGNVYASWVFDHGANPEASSYINGNLVSTDNSYVTIENDVAYLQFGQRNFGGASTDFYGKISEFIIFDRALTTNERKMIESYLKTKWGL